MSRNIAVQHAYTVFMVVGILSWLAFILYHFSAAVGVEIGTWT